MEDEGRNCVGVRFREANTTQTSTEEPLLTNTVQR